MRSIEWLCCRWHWEVPNPQIYPIFALFVAFPIFVIGERRDFKFGMGYKLIISSPSLRTTKQRGYGSLFWGRIGEITYRTFIHRNCVSKRISRLRRQCQKLMTITHVHAAVRNLVCFRSVTIEFNRLECVQRSRSLLGVSFMTFTRVRYCWAGRVTRYVTVGFATHF